MNIETINITIDAGPARAFIEAALRSITKAQTTPTDATTEDVDHPPQIGETWRGGIYAGISRGEDGTPDGHIVLLPEEPNNDMTWEDAMSWAQNLGDGARLPTRLESALLYANVRDKLNADEYHWTGTQGSASSAWNQSFTSGFQFITTKSYEGRARAVRRFVI